ncbi:MAG: hypothetical protein EB140_06005, partial [Proteobacteria bacterium]|nr:hypothetical protein [Pseudomonadota bacterium]
VLGPSGNVVRQLDLGAHPAGLVAWMPVRALAGVSADPWGFLLTPAAAVLMFVVAVPTFARGLRRYRQTGSSRYSTFGHRR